MAGIFYLHGFLSAGSSHKAQWFAEQFKGEMDVATPTYPISHPELTVSFISEQLADFLKTQPQCILVGASMGGFYAQYFAHLFGLPVILINPAVNPVGLLKDYLGTYHNPHTGEVVCLDEGYLAQIKSYNVTLNKRENALILLDKGDEVIDFNEAQKQYRDCAEVLCFDGGNHAFQHLAEALPSIRRFIKAKVRQRNASVCKVKM